MAAAPIAMEPLSFDWKTPLPELLDALRQAHAARYPALAAARLDGETLPAFTTMANDVSTAARGATTTLRRVDSTPQSFLFGPAPREPGPGESGFAGFGRSTK